MNEENIKIINKEILDKKYTCNFKMNYSKEEDNFIYLTISLSDEITQLLKEFCIVIDPEIISYVYGINRDNRYKVKSWLWNTLPTYAEDRNILFSVNLLTNKTLDLKFTNTNDAFAFVTGFRTRLHNVLDSILKYKNFDVTVSFNIQENKNGTNV